MLGLSSRSFGTTMRDHRRRTVPRTTNRSETGVDPNQFEAVSLDEASVLRSFGSKTYQTFLSLFDLVQHRYVATATPSPNRYKELIHYAGFLGVMDTGRPSRGSSNATPLKPTT